jgi:hypothetical protein
MEPTQLQVHVDIDCDSGEEFRGVVNWWLAALVALSPVVEATSRLDQTRLGGDWGYRQQAGPIQVGEYRPGARQDFDANLAQGFGGGHFNIYGLHQAGGPVRGLEVNCWCLSGDERKVQLLAEVKLSESAIPAEVDAVERELRDALQRFVHQARPWYAGMSDDFNRNSVPSDLAQAVNNAVARKESSRVLRGYSWVTYSPAHLADALGGAEALETSGVFWSVATMPGGVLLQATEHLRDYAGEVVRRVQQVLSPVLRDNPATKPPWPGMQLRQRHLRVAWDDGTSGPLGPRVTREEWGRFLEKATGKRYP